LQPLFSLFVTSPGSLVYTLVLVFSVIAALQVSLIGRQGAARWPARRLYLGLGMVLAGQVVLFLASGLAWQGYINLHVVMPPLDRAATVFALLWIIWMWAFPLANRLADGTVAVLSLVVVVAAVYSVNVWGLYPPNLDFNGSSFDQGWEIASLALILVGMFLLFLRRPAGWGIGLGMLAINLAGHLVQFLYPMAGTDFSGVVRLAIICSYPALPVLAQRSLMVTPVAVPQVTPPAVAAQPAKDKEASQARERRHYSADPRAVFGWLQMALYNEPGKLASEFTRAFGQTMLADLTLLVRASQSGSQIDILAGYDLIHEEFRPPASVEREAVPAIANALQKGRALNLNKEDGASPDAAALAQALGMADTGNLMFVPLAAAGQAWGGVLLLSPYSNRAWTADDQTYLLSSVESMVQVLQRPANASVPVWSAVSTVPSDPSQVRRELEQAQRQMEEMKGENKLLLEEIAALRSTTPSDEIESLLAVQKESQEIIANLQDENARLIAALGTQAQSETVLDQGLAQPAAVEASQPQDSYFEEQLRAALKQAAHLENALADSNSQILKLEQALQRQGTPVTDDARIANEVTEVINALVQEYRQPMASIMGYTDLLLAESAGIIGALQRNFLERIKGSIERLQGISNDLLQITHLQSGPLELSPEPINASVLIDDAVSAISSQVRAKNISLRVDLPDELPEIKADRDALQQIVVHLLQNASGATPVEGTISLKVRLQSVDNGEPAMLLQVTDTGGGIAAEDLPKVFARRYRADHALIQGVGDTGVGLSIARTLVEALQGKIWVESTPGQSSTFSVLLPLAPKSGAAAAS